MGVRISQLPLAPGIGPNDVFVMDGPSGTRKLELQDALVMMGTTSPTSSQGVIGSLYVQHDEDKIHTEAVYVKIESGWIKLPDTYITP